jgi:hypothetical protein
LKLAAVMMVRHEAGIIADSVGHLLHGLGVDRLYVADNGSTDATPGLLARMASVDARLQVTQAPGPFQQVEVMNALLQQAAEDGADWVLPNDADEFLWAAPGRLRRVLAEAGPVGGFVLPVRNFVQCRWVKRDRPGSIESMIFAARPAGAPTEARALVETGAIPFVRGRYGAKALLRASGSLRLTRGGHGGAGMAGPLAPLPDCELLHAPIRSRDDLDSRVAHAHRVLELDEGPDVSWHLKRLVGMSPAALEAEWQANSYALPGREGLRLDLRLSRLGWRLRRFRRGALADAGIREPVIDGEIAFGHAGVAD